MSRVAPRGRSPAECGQASVLLVGSLLVGLLLLGLAVDGTRMFVARRDLHNAADAAALAGAGVIDEDAYRAGAGVVRLDPEGARRAAEENLYNAGWVGRPGVDAWIGVDPSGDRVTVRLSRPVPTVFLRLAGLAEERIGAHATAAPGRP